MFGPPTCPDASVIATVEAISLSAKAVRLWSIRPLLSIVWRGECASRDSQSRPNMGLSLSAILTSSGNDFACIFFITWLRCILTVVRWHRVLPQFAVKHRGNHQVHHVALPNAYVGTRQVHRRAAASAIVRSSPVGVRSSPVG